MTKKKLMTAAFWLLLICPNILFLFIKNEETMASSEKRQLAEFPPLTAQTLETWPRSMENYINDHAAFRNQFLSLNASLNLSLFNHADSEEVIKGADGWLFFASGSSLSDCLGISRFSPEDLAYISGCIQKTSDYFQAQGIEFIAVLPPNKEDIYRSYLPDCYSQITETGKGEELAAYLKEHTTVPIIDPRAYFKQNTNFLWYYKTDTHWNDAAGYSVSQMIIEALGGTPTPISDITISYAPCEPGDLANLFHMPEAYNSDVSAIITGYRDNAPLSLADASGNGGIVYAEAPEAPDSRRIAFYRDSFGTAIANTLPKYFKNVDFYHWQSFRASLLEENKPDIIIYEIVERDQGRIPDDMHALAPEAFQ